MSLHSTPRIAAVKPVPVATGKARPDLEVKVTAPAGGGTLPVIVFSHGNGWSLDGYSPLAERWAAAGFIVVQPTHLDSRRIGIGFDDSRFGGIWRARIADVHDILDGIDQVLADAAPLDVRADPSRIAVVGHSWGAQTAGAVLGARVLDTDGRPGESFAHPKAAAGALIAATGTGDTLTDFARTHLPFMRPDYSSMAPPTLIVAGGEDRSRLSTRGPDWFTDAYHLSPAPKNMLTIADGEHTLGGVAGEMVAETTDEDPARVALVANAVSAFLLDAFGVDHAPWAALQDGTRAPDRIHTK